MRYVPKPGESIEDAAAALAAMAHSRKMPATMEFNAVSITAAPDDSIYSILRRFNQETFDRQSKAKDREELPSVPEKRRHQREFALKEELLKAPEVLSLLFPTSWLKFYEETALTSEFNEYIYRYAMRWGRLMEGRMARGDALEQCIRETRILADSEGRMTCFMYNEAVALLAPIWRHGAELRRWHNSDTRPGAEGDAANERNEVLPLPNPLAPLACIND